MSKNNINDPLETGFFSVRDRFSQVSAFSQSSIPESPRNETEKCPLCGDSFGVFTSKHFCSSCGISYCNKCSISKGEDPRFCDGCSSFVSPRNRAIEFPGLTAWIKRHKKVDPKKMWAIQASVDFFYYLFLSKKKFHHISASLVFLRYYSVVSDFQFGLSFVQSFFDHSLKCDCGCKAISLDLFVQYASIKGPIPDSFQIPYSQIYQMIVSNEMDLSKAALRLCLAMNYTSTDLTDFLLSNDSLVVAYASAIIANMFPLPDIKDLIRFVLPHNQVYNNCQIIAKNTIKVLDSNRAGSSYAAQYFCSILLLRVVESPEGAEEIIKKPLDSIIHLITKYCPKGTIQDNQHCVISCILSLVLLKLWVYTTKSKRSDEFQQILFPTVLQTVIDILQISSFYDHDSLICINQTIILVLATQIENNVVFGNSMKSDQIQKILNSLRKSRENDSVMNPIRDMLTPNHNPEEIRLPILKNWEDEKNRISNLVIGVNESIQRANERFQQSIRTNKEIMTQVRSEINEYKEKISILQNDLKRVDSEILSQNPSEQDMKNRELLDILIEKQQMFDKMKTGVSCMIQENEDIQNKINVTQKEQFNTESLIQSIDSEIESIKLEIIELNNQFIVVNENNNVFEEQLSIGSALLKDMQETLNATHIEIESTLITITTNKEILSSLEIEIIALDKKSNQLQIEGDILIGQVAQQTTEIEAFDHDITKINNNILESKMEIGNTMEEIARIHDDLDLTKQSHQKNIKYIQQISEEKQNEIKKDYKEKLKQILLKWKDNASELSANQVEPFSFDFPVES